MCKEAGGGDTNYDVLLKCTLLYKMVNKILQMTAPLTSHLNKCERKPFIILV